MRSPAREAQAACSSRFRRPLLLARSRDVVARAEALARGDRAGAAAEAGPCDPSPKRGAKAPRRPAKGTDRDRGAQMVMQASDWTLAA